MNKPLPYSTSALKGVPRYFTNVDRECSYAQARSELLADIGATLSDGSFAPDNTLLMWLQRWHIAAHGCFLPGEAYIARPSRSRIIMAREHLLERGIVIIGAPIAEGSQS